MPARRLGKETSPVQTFDVLGVDAENSPEFVRHVGLAAEDSATVKLGSGLAIVHMGPPLGTGFPTGVITCVGTSTLTATEVLKVRLFIDNHEAEYLSAKIRDARGQYCIAPHVRPYPVNGDAVVCLQFNCAGFVLEAYRFADLDLLDADLEALPLIPLDVLSRQYPHCASCCRIQRFAIAWASRVTVRGPSFSPGTSSTR